MEKVSKKISGIHFYISFGFVYEKSVKGSKNHCKEGRVKQKVLKIDIYDLSDTA